jgi:hypothetical protein
MQKHEVVMGRYDSLKIFRKCSDVYLEICLLRNAQETHAYIYHLRAVFKQRLFVKGVDILSGYLKYYQPEQKVLAKYNNTHLVNGVCKMTNPE